MYCWRGRSYLTRHPLHLGWPLGVLCMCNSWKGLSLAHGCHWVSVSYITHFCPLKPAAALCHCQDTWALDYPLAADRVSNFLHWLLSPSDNTSAHQCRPPRRGCQQHLSSAAKFPSFLSAHETLGDKFFSLFLQGVLSQATVRLTP